MQSFNKIIILGIFIIVSAYQGSLISATSGDDDMNAIIFEMKTIIKTQSTEIKYLQQEIQDQKKVVGRLQEKITFMEVNSINCKEQDKKTNYTASLREEALNSTSFENKKSIKVTKDPPEIYYCGYEEETSSSGSTINYGSLFYQRTNQPTGGLDIHSGVFTSPFPGTYSVTWSLRNRNYAPGE